MSVMARSCLVLAVVLGACASSSPAVIPFRGMPPAQILLVPTVGMSVDPVLVSAFDRNLRPAIERRGYRIVPIEVARRMLDDLDWTREQDSVESLPVTRLREQFGVEAVLVTELTELGDSGFVSGTVRATWRVYEAVSGDLLWETELVGNGGAQI